MEINTNELKRNEEKRQYMERMTNLAKELTNKIDKKVKVYSYFPPVMFSDGEHYVVFYTGTIFARCVMWCDYESDYFHMNSTEFAEALSDIELLSDAYIKITGRKAPYLGWKWFKYINEEK